MLKHSPMMTALQMITHGFNIAFIRVRLKFSRFEIEIIILIIHTEGVQLFPLFAGANRTDDATVKSPGKKATNGHIRYHLPFDRILHQITNLRDRGCKVITVFTIL